MKTGFQILPLLLVALSHPTIASRVQRRNGEKGVKTAAQEAPVVPASWFSNDWQSVWSEGCNSDHDKAMIETLSGVAKIRYENVMSANRTNRYTAGSCLWTLTMPDTQNTPQTFQVNLPKVDQQKSMEQKIGSFTVFAYHYPETSFDFSKEVKVQWAWTGVSFWSSKKTMEDIIGDLKKEQQSKPVELWVYFLSKKGEKKKFNAVSEAIEFLRGEIRKEGTNFQTDTNNKVKHVVHWLASDDAKAAVDKQGKAKVAVDELFKSTMSDVRNNFHMFALSNTDGHCWKIDHHSCILGHKSGEGLYAGMLGNPGNIHNITSALHE